jgi:hypothetical chaperone protein
MAKLACGIDFGTTNSSVAMSDGTSTRVLELDPFNDNPTSLPSLLYISRMGEYIVGRSAANAFIERNVDREVVLKQVELSVDIEDYVAGEGDNDYGAVVQKDVTGVREARRARATVEVNSPGRLFQSLKSSLRHRDFKETEVFGRGFQIDELVSMILKPVKEAADRAAEEDVDTAVFGRPVHFSSDPQEDAVAERRLRAAAAMAGFKHVAFFFEPVAACMEYASLHKTQQRLMVVDIGGGTCDVCIMDFAGHGGDSLKMTDCKVLGVAGVSVAGDAIDREIIRGKLYPALGSRSRYGPSQLPMPQFIYNALADWQNLYKLNNEEIINWLIASEGSSTQPDAIRTLRHLIQRNQGYPLNRKVEAAKKTLSSEWEASIELHNELVHLEMVLSRGEFTHIIEPTLEDMLASIEEAERAAGITAESIDYVLTTGGTSLIPAVRRMMVDRFGEARLIQRDTFTSVATGLAVIAERL